MAVTFFSVRRASGVTQLVGGDVGFDNGKGVAQPRAKRQKNDQFWAGQMAHFSPMETLGAACSAKLLSGWLWPRSWSRQHRDHAGHLSGAYENLPFFVCRAGAEFGLEMAACGITASWEKVLGGRVFLPRKGGTRMYIMHGMSREASQELGGWQTPGVMDCVFNETKSEGAAPEIRGAIGLACALLAVETCVRDLYWNAPLADGCVLGSDRAACTNACFPRFSSLEDHLAPSVALPIRGNFISFPRRRVRAPGLSDTQQRVILLRGVDHRAALREARTSDSEAAVRARDRDATLGDGSSKMSRAS